MSPFSMYMIDLCLFSETMTANWARDAYKQNSFTGKKNASLKYMDSGEYQDFQKISGWICY